MRLFQMSTQGPEATENARFALDARRSLEPVADRLLAERVPAELVDARGHVWGFKDRTVFTGRSQPRPGDVALRVEPGAVLRRLYRVLAVFPDDPKIAYAINGRPWIENPPGGFRHSVVFEPFDEITPRPYLDAMRQFDPQFEPGFNYRGKFLDDLGPAEAVLEALLGAPPSGRFQPAPEVFDIDDTRRPRRTSLRQTRGSNAMFRARVFHAQRDARGLIACSACAVADEDVLEAAHIVDEGYAADEWWNGLPLCRNHHRLFDLGKLALHPDTSAWSSRGGNLNSVLVTKPNIRGLTRQPSRRALMWKWRDTN
ncbi:HNH endonuclease [Geodermatophilus obscurus]|uniref:HNH endonuclease n=1 Tax=Geodermatophilus obscurus TaxID=1861 RepID=A0A1I5IBG2_9ACTN|nr:HNH endonuclease signature motif containing protein [Geodermatophilus obscurus]SFO57863.1 HNH endonuclease [Geodermatophilus obscurus]